MTSEISCIEEDVDLQLIDFSEEDDYLIAFPFRDSLEDFRLSVTFDNANERINHVQSESVEPRRPSFLRKSLAWDSAFFTSAGVLNPEELFMINKGFKKAETSQPSPGTNKRIRPRRVVGKDQTSSENDGFQLGTLEDDLFEDLRPKIHKFSKRSNDATCISSPACNQSNSFSSKKMNICPQNKVKSVRAPKSQNLNLQGPKNLTKTRIKVGLIQNTWHANKSSLLQDNVSSLPKLISSRHANNAAVEGSDTVTIENKTRKGGTAPDLTVSKRSRRGDLSGIPKSTSLTFPSSERKSKVHYSYESSSSASSSKSSIRRKINPRNTKLMPNSPSSVHFLLSSTCSSSTSPASSIDGWFSESLSSDSVITHQNPGSSLPTSDFQSQNFEEIKFTSQNATRSSIGTSLFSGGPKRKIKSSGLRMPSPKIGFFDEEPVIKGQSPLPNENRLKKLHSSNHSPSVSTENFLKVGKILSREHDGRKFGVSCSKVKQDQPIFKEILKNRTTVKQKRQKDNIGSSEKLDESDQKENRCSFEDQVNGLSKHLEDIDLNRDMVEVKGQWIHQLSKQGQLTLPVTADHTTPCSRTPLAEKLFGK